MAGVEVIVTSHKGLCLVPFGRAALHRSDGRPSPIALEIPTGFVRTVWSGLTGRYSQCQSHNLRRHDRQCLSVNVFLWGPCYNSCRCSSPQSATWVKTSTVLVTFSINILRTSPELAVLVTVGIMPRRSWPRLLDEPLRPTSQHEATSTSLSC